MSRADISARVSAILNERRNGAFIAANENYARASKDEKFRRADLKARDLIIKVSLLSSQGEDATEEKKQLRAAEKADKFRPGQKSCAHRRPDEKKSRPNGPHP